MARVAVAMSGGVDSSAAAAILRRDGHDVVGITLQLWDYSEINAAAGAGRCCSPADIADARAVSARLEIPHYVFDHRHHFRTRIVQPFLDAYGAGQTPSPCISCNRHVKFDALWDIARGLGAEHLATGHYARLRHQDARPQVRKALDEDKDQSYFLFDVPASRLNDVQFPLGQLSKAQVRATARELGLAVADKPESYELCFIPDGDKDRFIERERGSRASQHGEIRTSDGTVLAHHEGTHRFTVGQRRGLGLGGGQKLYVLDVDGASGTVTVGDETHLFQGELTASSCNWLAIEPPRQPTRVAARIRHRHQEAAAWLDPLADDRCRVRFDEPQRAVAAGQGVAFYDGDLLLGGGWIEPSPTLATTGC